MTDRYCVFGNPIGHSKSPAIHTRFAQLTGEDIAYVATLAPLDGFTEAVRQFARAGGRGANVTVPFKEEAFRLCTRLTPRAALAEAVNTLIFDEASITGDNTDGAGLVRDIEHNLAFPIAGRHVLLLGAGGAARGALGPLLDAGAATVTVANRTAAKAVVLAEHFSALGQVDGCSYSALAGKRFDLIVNATSASLGGELPPLPPQAFAPGSLAYDMMYGQGDTPFLAFARSEGAARLADGLGMLVEQAAEAFYAWRHVRPDTGMLLAEFRQA